MRCDLPKIALRRLTSTTRPPAALCPSLPHSQLQTLNLSCNKLSTLPPSTSLLTSLKVSYG